MVMNDHWREWVPTGRDVAGAWLFCVAIAGLALALSADLHRGVPPAATIAASPSPCPRRLGSFCQGSVEATATWAGAVPGLHRLALPTPHGDAARPG
jgi:hypothetical protein